ncbi:MAG: hypothetical protein FJX74_16625, partial [Armatimonadetes bacterium]|nr:hypothetical protein [Armatimonadota bacterium]
MATLHAPQRPVDTIEGLSNAEQALAGAIIAHADTSDADVFYREIEPELRGYCEAIAHRVGCDSVALFVAEEAGETYLRMRAAYGNLAWAMDSGSEAGVVYPRPDNLPDSISEEDLRTLVKGGGKKSERWGLTLRSWLLGRAFVANTRQDLDYLASRRPDERGPTDHEAYPVHDETKGWAMRTVFRSLLCIPIFARGRTRPPLFLPDDEPDHREFLSAYRVVGLIKLEGKHAKPAARLDWQSFAPQSVTSEVLRETQKRVEAWRRATNLSLRELIGGKADLRLGEQGELVRPRPPIQAANRDLLSRAGSDPDRPPYGKIIDALSEFLGARFTWHDARAVVAMAMQFGRLLALRVSQHADSRELLLDENIVGALDIRHDDVEPLASLMRAANRACHKLRHEMEALEHRIEDAERSEWEQLRPDEPFERRRPIREKRGRVKELGELLAKVARKTAETEERPPEQRVEVADGVQVCLTGVQPLSDGRLELNGPVDLRVELARAPLSTTPPKDEPPVPRAQISGKLTTGPVTCDLSQLGRGASAGSPGADVRRSGDLIHRIVNVHRIDDIAGVRVVCAYLSDINRVLNAMQAQFPE